MKFKTLVLNELEKGISLSNSIKKGMDNKQLTPQELYDLNGRMLICFKRASQRVELEYDENR